MKPFSKELKITAYNAVQNEINKSCKGIPCDIKKAMQEADMVGMITR